MAQIQFTSTSVNLRSSPQDLGDDNILNVLPAGHPVEVFSQVNRDWVSIRTAHRNSIWRGFIGIDLLRKGGGWEVPDSQRSGMPIRGELLLDEESTKLGSYLGVSPPDTKARGAEALNMHRSRILDIDWN